MIYISVYGFGCTICMATVQGDGGPSRDRTVGAKNRCGQEANARTKPRCRYTSALRRRRAPTLAGNRDIDPNRPQGPRHSVTYHRARQKPVPHLMCNYDPVYRPTGLDRIAVPRLGCPDEPHRIRLEHLQHLPIDARKRARDRPARTARAPRRKSAFSLGPAPSEAPARRSSASDYGQFLRLVKATAQSCDLIAAHVCQSVLFLGETKTPLRVPYGILNRWCEPEKHNPLVLGHPGSPLLSDALRGRWRRPQQRYGGRRHRPVKPAAQDLRPPI